MTAPMRERYFFIHLQKTGGTTLVHRLPRHFRPSEIYPNDSDGDVVQSTISVDHLKERWLARGHHIRVVAGHFPLCTTELLGGGFTTLTVLREPVERTLSYLRHHRQMTPADRDKPLEAIYDDPFRFDSLIHNHMVKMLSLTTDEMVDGVLTSVDFTPSRLALAKHNLERVDVIGFQEQFSDFWSALSLRLGWRLGEVAYSNRTESSSVPGSFRRRIAKDNSLDVELYDHVLAHQGQLAEHPSGAPIP
jgi:hypothetical protein